MLRQAGVAFRAQPSAVDETAVKQALLAEGAGPAAIARTLAEMKAVQVSRACPGALVVGADQTLACEDRLFDKPPDLAAARAMLRALAGRSHELHSAATVACDGVPIWRHVETARLVMRPLSEDFLDWYIATADPAILGSVGAYRVEATGAHLFTRIEGDLYTVLGLPLLALLDLLRRHELVPA